MKIESGKKIGIVACSNAQSKRHQITNDGLLNVIDEIAYGYKCSEFLYETDSYFSGTGNERADALMKFYEDEEIGAIFDISGGDIANEILPYLDFDIIKNSNKTFYGYSDLTTIINAIYAKTNKESGLYQIRNLVYENAKEQQNMFKNSFVIGSDDIENLSYYFIQERYMEGEIIGGNIRCFLKLAGTEYMPDFEGKILLLEALNASSAQVMTYLCQLKQLGAFEKINGILLGTFTKLDADIFVPSVEELIQKVVGKNIPIARTFDIGHGTNAKCIYIGRHMIFNE